MGSWFGRRERIDREIEDELRFHVECKIERYVHAGMSPEEARRKALECFGNFERIRDTVREIDLGLLESVWQDLRYGVRALARSPGFTAVAVLSLALGIGLNSAIFSAVNAVLLRPLPYKDPERLMTIGQVSKYSQTPNGISPANFFDWQRQNTVFESMAFTDPFDFGEFGRVALGGNQPVLAQGLQVSASFFDVFGVQPALGRVFTAAEDNSGARVVVLSHDFWRRRFDTDPRVLGQEILLNDGAYRIIGVMPKGFRYEQWDTALPEIDFWLPGIFQLVSKSNRVGGQLRGIARLKPGVTPDQARAEMAVIGERLAKAYPKENRFTGLGAVPLLEALVADARPGLLLFLAAVGLVLLIACANVANLLLARAGVRRREIAIRTAIGAGRPRLVRQLFTESVLLAAAGGLAGVALTYVSARLIGWVMPEMYRLDEAGIDLRVLAFTVAISLASALLFGLAPAIQISKAVLNDELRDAGRNVSQSRGSARLRGGLVMLQVALSLVLLAGAGLMINSFWRLHQTHLGFEPDHLLTVPCILPKSPRYVTDLGFQRVDAGQGRFGGGRVFGLTQMAIDFPERVAERLEKLPGVASAAGSISGLPLARTLGNSFAIEGRPAPSPSEAEPMTATRFGVTSDYFRTFRIRLLHGREFDERDGPGAPRVVIVNQALARLVSPVEWDAIGQRIVSPAFVPSGQSRQAYAIVGVVDDTRLWPRQDHYPQMYFAQAQYWQQSYPLATINSRLELYFVVRTRSDPATAAGAVIDAIHKEDPWQPVDEIRTMDEVVAKAFGPWRSTMLLIGIGIPGFRCYP
jgi:putative ABC transport system permease protein